MLILEILLNVKLKQDNVTAAFLHANLEKDEKVFVEMPLGFRKKGNVLKLRKLFMTKAVPVQFLEISYQGYE